MSHNPRNEDDYYAIAYQPKEQTMIDGKVTVYVDPDEVLRARYQHQLDRISMPFNWSLRLVRDPKSKRGEARFWLCVHVEVDKCVRTGDDYSWNGREWMLREDMTDSEIMRTAFLATRGAVEHELHEMFKIDGQRPFDPHLDLTRLAAFAADPINTDQPKEG